jgi:hypothetical protein
LPVDNATPLHGKSKKPLQRFFSRFSPARRASASDRFLCLGTTQQAHIDVMCMFRAGIRDSSIAQLARLSAANVSQRAPQRLRFICRLSSWL